MKIHFIAIGGAVMPNLAIALQIKGNTVTGSDDEIFEPSVSRLEKYGILPEKWGWYPDRINSDIDTVILGMHARADNPELLRALELGIKIMSFPEFLYSQTLNKKRIVVAGSYGKSTTTAMIMHVFRYSKIKFDFMAGSQTERFETLVGLSDESRIAVFEGDEYLASALDKRPQFLHYKPDIAVLNGIAWDHKNVFPAFDIYTGQFRLFAESITEEGSLIYFDGDPEVKRIALSLKSNINKIPYKVHGYFQNKTGFYAATHNRVVPVRLFGEHNMQNLSAAREVCLASGISEDDFYEAIKSFEGTSGRLQKLKDNERGLVYLDFANSPSKVKATVEAVVSRYPKRKTIACLELHTYSSLSSDILQLYKDTLSDASSAFVYFNPHEIELKKLKHLSKETVENAFGGGKTMVFDNSEEMFSYIISQNYSCPVYLLMSAGDFDGFDINRLTE